MSDPQNEDGGHILAALLWWVALVCFVFRMVEVIQISWWWFAPLGILLIPYLLVIVPVLLVFVLLESYIGTLGALLALWLLVPAGLAGICLLERCFDEKERRVGQDEPELAPISSAPLPDQASASVTRTLTETTIHTAGPPQTKR